MKKNIFFAVAVIMMALCTACENNKAGETTTPLEGSEYTIVTTAKGAMGLKLGNKVIVEPSDSYKSFAVVNGMIIAESETELGGLAQKGQVLISPVGKVCMSADNIKFEEPLWLGRGGGVNTFVYVPATGLRFAGKEFAVSGKYAAAVFKEKITIFKDTMALIEPTEEFQKIAVYGDEIIVYDGKMWGKASIKEKNLEAGNALSAKELKSLKAKKGWSDKARVMILE